MPGTSTGAPPALAPEGRGRRVLVIHNPTAGWRRRHRLAAVLVHLEALGCEVRVQPTGKRGDAEAFARDARDGLWDVVAVAGGDGTINEAANGLYGGGLPLAVIPLGTANVLAAEIGLPTDAAGIARVIATAPARPVCVGVANRRLFVMMAGVGFDAHVVASVRADLKRALGKGAYALITLAGLWRFSGTTYRVTVDGTDYAAASAVIANGHFYGGRMSCAPAARLEDPRLHACLFLKPGPWRALRYALWLMMGRLHRLPDIAVVAGRRVTVAGPDGDPVQGDGDIISAMPLTVDVAETMLSVIAPA